MLDCLGENEEPAKKSTTLKDGNYSRLEKGFVESLECLSILHLSYPIMSDTRQVPPKYSLKTILAGFAFHAEQLR